MVVPHELARQLGRGQTADVQVLINGVSANTAQLAQGHVQAAVAWLNQKPGVVAPVELRTALLYNPDLENTWFTVAGVLGALIVLNGSLVAATAIIKEKERGTVERLLMTPASAIEVVAAKIAPLIVLLLGMTGLALTVARLVFHVPFRGSLMLLLFACACWVLTGIGTFVATMARSATPGAAHAVLRQPAAHGPLRRLHADRGHAEVDPAFHLSEPDRPLRRARSAGSPGP